MNYKELKKKLREDTGLENIRPQDFEKIKKNIKQIIKKMKEIMKEIDEKPVGNTTLENKPEEDEELEELLKQFKKENKGLR